MSGSAVKVGELYAELGLNDLLTRGTDKAEQKFRAAARSMDEEATLGLDDSNLEQGLERSKRKARDGGKDIGDQLGDGIDQAAPDIEAAGSNFGGLLVAGAAGAVAGGGAIIVGEFSNALDRESATANLGIQLGLTPELAQAAGQVSGEIYADAFGDSLGEVNDALRFVGTNMGGFGDKTKAEVEDITKGVLTLADVFDQDLNQVTAAAGTLMTTGLAKNGMEALDLLTRGLQSPANKADDLLDTFIEYSTQFRKLGITGPMALGLMSQGLKGGARDADIVADAFKEFSIRAIDGSDLTVGAFQTLGLNAETTAAQIAAGGPVAATGVQMILDKLLAIEDPVERNRVGVALFGTQWEDMGAAVNGLDLQTAVDEVGSVEGAMKNATDATSTNQAKVEEWKRSMEENVTNWIAETGIPVLEGWAADWENMTGTVGRFHDGLIGLGDGLRFIKDDIIDPVVGSLQGLYNVLQELGNSEIFKTISSAAGGLTGLLGIGPDTLMSAGGGLAGLIGSFDTGGVVPGPKGKPQLAKVHGGETILPTHKPMRNEIWYEDGSGVDDYGQHWNPDGTMETPEQAAAARAYLDRFFADRKAGMEFAAMAQQKQEQDNAALRYITATQGQRGQGGGFDGTAGRPIVVHVMLGKRELGRAVVEADRPMR